MRAAICLAVLLLAPSLASAMSMIESRPAGGAVMNGKGEEFYVRFDAPINHKQSRLTIERDGRLVRSLRTRLNSSPETLYARVAALPPGSYDLHWSVRAATDGAQTDGLVPFSVTK